jgi:aerobic-type carbon monoxide dehydrogenase small subunit (CoxS/CutS family)
VIPIKTFKIKYILCIFEIVILCKFNHKFLKTGKGIPSMKKTINFKLNGKPVTLDADGGRKLLWVLRTDLGLTGTKYGCGESYCGACTVIVNNDAVRSCQISVEDVQDKDVITIEGLIKGDKLHPLQKAFAEHDALQCGYCTPGMIMSAYSLLKKNSSPSVREIKAGLEDNLCRCGAYKRIISAVQTASAEMKGVN